MTVLDLLIRGGRVIDGSGAPAFPADVGIAGDRIAAVGRVDEAAARTIDATGLFVCPGFVDMHTHSDLKLLTEPLHEAKVCQGVTLEVLGQDGLSYAPVTDEVLEQLRAQLAGWNGDPPGFDWSWRSVAEYLDRLDEGIAVNAAYLVPHGTLRACAMGYDDRAPTGPELAHMRRLLAEGLEQGAVGLSAGLTYAPGMYADDDELVALCEVVHDFGGFYCPHHRNYGLHALEAYADQIEIARRAGVPLHFAHAHLGFDVNRGRAPELLALIDGSGIDVTLDTYPYLAGATYLHAFLPSWMHAGGAQETLARLRDPSLRERLRVEMEIEGSDGFHEIPIDW
jgi:N-acyl-D-amino-acid deacylase